MSGRTLAIGDVHGCDRALQELIDRIQPTSSDTIIFLGDVIDRGPASKQAVEQILRLRESCKVVLIMGNHEELMRASLSGRPGMMDQWRRVGGRETIASYGTADNIPSDHLRLLVTGAMFWETDTEIFIHASLETGVSLVNQSTLFLRWKHLGGTEPPQACGKRVICGHTAQRDGAPLVFDGWVCIDTYAHGGGWLTRWTLKPITSIRLHKRDKCARLSLRHTEETMRQAVEHDGQRSLSRVAASTRPAASRCQSQARPASPCSPWIDPRHRGLPAVGVSVFNPLAGLGLLVAALVLLAVHVSSWLEIRLRERISREQTSLQIANFTRGLEHRWDDVEVPDVDAQLAESALATDLELFGYASLMQRICVAETNIGRRMLATWLAEPAATSEIHLRQRLARQLACSLSWRMEFQRRCAAVEVTIDRTEQLLDWADGKQSSAPPKPVFRYAAALPLLIAICAVTAFFRIEVAAAMLLAIIAVNFLLTVIFSGDIHSEFRRLAPGPEATSYRALSDVFEHLGDPPTIRELLPEVAACCRQATLGLRSLERILRWESVSHNPLTFIYIYWPLQLTLLWDQQAYRLACRWRQQSGDQMHHWLETLGKMEAVNCLATLTHEQPGWSFPDLCDEATPHFDATDLGHPLLRDDVRVCNDVSVGPPGTMLLISGCNMGGKSTILRAIGVNAVLAQAGGPCCCQSLSMSPLTVLTNINAADSLADSKSLFMAQLSNLKRVVDVLRGINENQELAPGLYLFDEILNGTNTTDRRIVVEGLVQFLLQSRDRSDDDP